MSTFLDAVNRVLRVNGFLGDDDDDLTSFTTNQHQASMNIAKIAIQTTLTSLAGERLIPYEETEDTFTYVTDQRAYTLASDFVRFAGEPYIVELDGSSEATTHYLYEWKGGESKLRRQIHNYRTLDGQPLYWYPINSTSKKIGVYPVPDSDKNGTAVRYVYEKVISVTVAGDTMPFHNTMEFDQFCIMASRAMKYMFEKLPAEGLEQDIIYTTAKSSLYDLMRTKEPSKKYGYDYV